MFNIANAKFHHLTPSKPVEIVMTHFPEILLKIILPSHTFRSGNSACVYTESASHLNFTCGLPARSFPLRFFAQLLLFLLPSIYKSDLL